MLNLQVFVSIFFCIFFHGDCQNAKFDDSMLYDISWSGPRRSGQNVRMLWMLLVSYRELWKTS